MNWWSLCCVALVYAGPLCQAVVFIDPDSLGKTDVTNGFGDVYASGDRGARLELGLPIVIGDSGHGAMEVTDDADVRTNGNATTLGRDAGSVGTLQMSGVGSSWNGRRGQTGTLTVGYLGSGAIELSSGASMTFYKAYIGGDSNRFPQSSYGSGTVTVRGEGSDIDVSSTLTIGHRGTGSLTVEEGGNVGGSSVRIGWSGSQANGVVLVDGEGSELSSHASVMVGDGERTVGSLTIQNGGYVENNAGYVGKDTNSSGDRFATGTVVVGVEGAAGSVPLSQWSNEELYIGMESSTRQGGVGTVRILDRGQIDSAGGLFIGSRGSLSLEGGDLNAAEVVSDGSVTLTSSGSTLNVSGSARFGHNEDLDATLSISSGSTLGSGSGYLGGTPSSSATATVGEDGAGADVATSYWQVDGDLHVGTSGSETEGGTGSLHVLSQGVVQVSGGVTLGAGDRVEVAGGELIATSVRSIDNDSEFILSSGTLTTAAFHGDLTQTGGTFSPGQSPGATTVDGSYTLGDSGTLLVEIQGAVQGVDYDWLTVTEDLTLAGALNVALSGFTPTSDSTFDILDWGGGLNGTFGEITLSDVSGYGLEWNTDALYSAGQLSLTAVPETEFYGMAIGTLLIVLAAKRRLSGAMNEGT